MTVVACPSCSQEYRAESAQLGEQARCGKCGTSFRIGPEPTVDDETVIAWMTEDTPATTGGGRTGTASVVADVPVHSGVVVRLTHLSDDGAHFEFPAALLASEQVRSALPRACVGCGTAEHLMIHLIRWQDRMNAQPANTQAPARDTPVGSLAEFNNSSTKNLLALLPNPSGAREPFHLPFPMFTCPRCQVDRGITAWVISRNGHNVCRLTITSLSIATEFLRNNGGGDSSEYHQLIEAHDRQHHAWRTLNSDVRDRITHWFTPLEGERFVGFHHDAEASIEHAGISGLVLTDRRLVYQRYAACREFPLDTDGRLEIRPAGTTANIRIFEEEDRPATIKIDRADADELETHLRTLGCVWTIVR